MPQERIYFDNAATTPVDPEVIEAMNQVLLHHFGNPSSLYSYGREAKMKIELARKEVAQLLNVKSGEVFFTSGGTESINTAVNMALYDLQCKAIITSAIEHHATLHAIEDLSLKLDIPVYYVDLTENGHLDLDHLEELLSHLKVKTYVSLMHANNEIGNILDIEKVAGLCQKYQAIFHCDTVQTLAHYPIKFKELNISFASGAAHKFHGPKGVGVLLINEAVQVKSWLKGGGQERNMRAGTENIAGIVGLAKALRISLTQPNEHEYVGSLKQYLIDELATKMPQIEINGDYNGACLSNIVNLRVPYSEDHNMLLMNLDIKGVCVSGGSACSSGASTNSHVISKIYPDIEQTPLRVSFSKYNQKEEIDKFIAILRDSL